MARAKKTVVTDKTTLQVEARTEVGKRVRMLRKSGFIAANVFGEDYISQAIKIVQRDFMAAYKVARETGIIYMTVNAKEIPTLITNIQKDPVRDTILHVDFRKIDLKHKLETVVPILIIGESDAVKHHNGVLLTQTDHLTVEALPTDIPQHIEIDIAALKEIDSSIKVADLPKSDKYEIKEDTEKVIVSVTAHKEESVTPETTAEAPEITTEKAGEEGAEGAEATAAPAEAKEEKKAE